VIFDHFCHLSQAYLVTLFVGQTIRLDCEPFFAKILAGLKNDVDRVTSFGRIFANLAIFSFGQF
jgi:hypothetical protein